MPFYHPMIREIDEKEMRRYAGLARAKDFPDNLIKEACEEALLLIQPKGIWQIYGYDDRNQIILSPTPLKLKSQPLIEHLQGSVQIAVMAVTIGAELEGSIENCFKQDRYALGLLLDAAATAAVEQTADAVNSFIAQEMSKVGLVALRRFSPGYGDWDITDQSLVVEAAQGEHIQLSVTESCMLVPRKSVTAVIGLTPHEERLILPSSETATCLYCEQENCASRKENHRK